MSTQDYINKITCSDCLEVMKNLDDNSVDLVLTDPPYGINIANNSFRQKFEKSDWDKHTPTQEYFKEMFRISKNQIIFGGNYFILAPSQGFIIWDKGQPENFSSAMCEYAWSSFQSPAKIFYYRVITEQKYHPTQKPVPLFKWILNKYSKENAIILDPFLGSGTTAVACRLLNRNFIGIEISPEYCKIAEQRLAKIPNTKLETFF